MLVGEGQGEYVFDDSAVESLPTFKAVLGSRFEDIGVDELGAVVGLDHGPPHDLVLSEGLGELAEKLRKEEQRRYWCSSTEERCLSSMMRCSRSDCS